MNTLLSPGQVFADRYRIERHLADGGMGAVFVAEHLETERKVALKVLWPHVLSSPKSVEQFRLEARVAARVQSENIVQILDSGQDVATRMPFLVMELLQGQSLEDYVEQHGPLPPTLAIELLRQVALGLDKAHGYVGSDGTPQPIVHRDLKPENLFLTYRDSGAPHVKILDFGLAKVMSETASLSQETKGTPLYMAFEQAAGKAVTPRTDVWALGLIAFYLLTGRVYWASAHRPDAGIQNLFSEILALPLAPASDRLGEFGVESTLPNGFDDWLSRCIDREPTARFPSAGQAIERLASLFADNPVSTAPLYALDSTTAFDSLPVGVRQPIPPPTPGPLDAVPTRVSPRLVQAASHAAVSNTLVPMQRRGPGLALALGALAIGGAAVAFFALRQGEVPAEATPAAAVQSGESVPLRVEPAPAPAPTPPVAPPPPVPSVAPVTNTRPPPAAQGSAPASPKSKAKPPRQPAPTAPSAAGTPPAVAPPSAPRPADSPYDGR